MRCNEVRPLLNLLLDEELEEEQSVEVAEHLDGCAGCRTIWNKLTLLRQKVAEYRDGIKVPANLEERVRTASASMPPAPRLARRFMLAAAASATVLVLAGVSIAFRQAPAVADPISTDEIVEHTVDHPIKKDEQPAPIDMAACTKEVGVAPHECKCSNWKMVEIDECCVGCGGHKVWHMTFLRRECGRDQQVTCYQMPKGCFDRKSLAEHPSPSHKEKEALVNNMHVMLVDSKNCDAVLVSTLPEEMLYPIAQSFAQ